MAFIDYAGSEIFTADGERLGRVKGSLKHRIYGTDYLVIEHSATQDIVVPMSIVEESGGRYSVPYAKAFMEDVPRVDLSSGALTDTDRLALDDYYTRLAA